MSSAVVSTSAASRLFVFADGIDPVALPHSFATAEPAGVQESAAARVQSAIKNQQSKIPPASVTPASQLEIRLAPEMVSTGVPAIDALTGGLPRGCITEICGSASSGCTTLLLSALAAATDRGEFCAVVDVRDSLDPHSVAAAGVQLEKLLWVRCDETSPGKRVPSQGGGSKFRTSAGKTEFRETPARNERQTENRLEQALRATDMLLDSGGFGLIALDLGDLPPQVARYIPLTTWFRFRRAIEHTPTILLAIEQQPIAGSCSSLLLKLQLAAETIARFKQDAQRSDVQLLTAMEIAAEVVRARLERKPVRSASISFNSKTAWVG